MSPALSPSRAADFKQCPLKYRFRTIDRLDEAPSPAAARGTLVHAALETLFDLPAHERTPDAAVSLLPERWTAMVDEGVGTRLVQGHASPASRRAAWYSRARSSTARQALAAMSEGIRTCQVVRPVRSRSGAQLTLRLARAGSATSSIPRGSVTAASRHARRPISEQDSSRAPTAVTRASNSARSATSMISLARTTASARQGSRSPARPSRRKAGR